MKVGKVVAWYHCDGLEPSAYRVRFLKSSAMVEGSAEQDKASPMPRDRLKLPTQYYCKASIS